MMQLCGCSPSCHLTYNMSGLRLITTERKVSSLCKHLATLNKEDVELFLQSFDTVLTDCDGVLWLHNNIIPGAPEAIRTLKELGKKVFYITNNSTKTRDQFISKCTNLGFSAVRDDVLSTAYLTAYYFHDLKFDKKVYVVGSKGIGEELDAVNIQHIGIGPDPTLTDFGALPQQIELDAEVGAVVVGMDEHVSFPKLTKATSYLRNPDCLFVATNTDEVFPTPTRGLTIPGTGSLVAAVETAAGRKAFKIGKPNTFVCDFVTKHHNVNPARTLMIGDRCNTDILFGTQCGFTTLLVLTGVTSLVQVDEWKASDQKEENDLVPDYYIESLGDLLPLIQ